MSSKFAKFVLCRVLGWTCVGNIPEDKCCIFLFAPHTSIWDFAIGYLYYRSMGGHLKAMIKKEAFFPPVGWLLKSLGGIPIDRKHPAEAIMGIVGKIEKDNGTFHLVICPEGTRKPIRKWKTGYHTIASRTGVPVYLGFMDYNRKVAGTGPKVELTADARADTDRIQKMFEDMDLTALHPEDYCTH